MLSRVNFALTQLYRSRARNVLLALALLPLLLVSAGYLPAPWERVVLLLHVLLFVTWHPFWLGQLQLSFKSSGLLLLSGAVVVGAASLPVLSLWIVLVASLLAAEPFKQRRDIFAQGLAIVFLLSTLFIYTLPGSFDLAAASDVRHILFYILAAALLLLACLPPQYTHDTLRQMDILISLIFFQVVTTTAMGTVLFVLYQHGNYFSALLASTFSAGLFLVFLNLIWKLFSGTTALSFLWNRYLLVLGSPFESLLLKFSALAKTTQSPGQYLELSFTEMNKMEWLTGIHWRAASGSGELGETASHQLDIEIADISIRLYARQPIHGALAMHARLLTNIITHFYHSIKRERSLAHRAHVQAVYETGARLTHDIKNLLQGMKTLSAAGENTSDPAAFHALFMRQLPTMSERLETTLRKLTEPRSNHRDSGVYLSQWWLDLQQRYQGRNIGLHAEIELDRQIPAEMFNTVSENLLENARAKRLHDRDIAIQAQLVSNADGIVFSVSDTGYCVPADKAQYLMSEPVQSEQGLGVGLYQAFALAKHQGYELVLESNLDGMVCFTLASKTESH